MRIKAEISASAFSENLSLISKTVFPSKIMLVVKANAYGHGIDLIAKLAKENSVEWLGVTTVKEAEEVLKHYGEAKIFCFFEPEDSDEAEFAVRNDVAVNLFSEKALELLIQAAKRTEKRARVHIKINTGMNRLGISSEKFAAFAENVTARKEISIEGVWTHFATSELPDDDFTHHQLKLFERAVRRVKEKYPHILLHAANTGAAIYYPQSRFDLVRIGIGAYGYYPSRVSPKILELKPVLTLKAKINSVNSIAEGDGVSYGLKWKAPKPCYVATVAAGYADGVPYTASNRLKIRYKGAEFQQVGSVCMDQFVVNFENELPEPGEEVEIIYDGQTAEEIARISGTITYEVLSRLGQRIHRVLVP